MELIEIGQAGDLAQSTSQPDVLRSVVEATVELYHKNGFIRPWVGYIAVRDGVAVGTCGFKSPPVDGSVEIAYFTFPGNEGQGIATSMASQLVQIANEADGIEKVIAQTLPEENASTRVLKKLGFQFVRPVGHAEDGLVWEWELST
jgi:RimJ/RimL family protein N-acetyltransferase